MLWVQEGCVSPETFVPLLTKLYIFALFSRSRNRIFMYYFEGYV